MGSPIRSGQPHRRLADRWCDWAGVTGDTTDRSDLRDVLRPHGNIYAFGAVLYEMLVGRPPFDAVDRTGLESLILHRDLPSVRAARADVPPAVAALIQQCLAKAPEARCARLEDALAILHAVRPASAKKPRAASRHSSSRRIRSVAVLPFRLIGAPADSEYLAAGMTDLLIARIV